MVICPNCNHQCDDDAKNCPHCGAKFISSDEHAKQQSMEVFDHTAEFSEDDVSDNKAYAMACYTLGLFGILIASIAGNDSRYVMFHVKQALKLWVLAFASLILCIIPILGWLVSGLCIVAAEAISVLSFIDVIKGKSKEPMLIRSLKFMK